MQILWLDVEGHEYEILNTYPEEILSKIKYIYTEVSFIENRENSKLYWDVKKLLEQFNFREISLYTGGIKVLNPTGHGCDVLFENMSF